MGNCFESKYIEGAPLRNIQQAQLNEQDQNSEIEQTHEPIYMQNHSEDFNRSISVSVRRQKQNIQKIRGFDEIDEDQLYENIVKIERKQTQEDYQFIITSLKNNFALYSLSDEGLKDIISQMFYCEVSKNEFIFKQGDNASSYFIVEKGLLQVIINGQLKTQLHKGATFGELALLYRAPRSGSIKALEDCGLWGIDTKSFRKAVEEISTQEYQLNRQFIDAITFFNSMSPKQKDALTGGLILQKFSSGQNIVNEGDDASSFFIIKEGIVSVQKDNVEIRKLTKGEYFGEQALYSNGLRSTTIKALGDAKVLALGKDTATNILGDQFQMMCYKNIKKWALKKSQVFSKLNKIQIDKIIENMEISNQSEGAIIYAKGTLSNSKLVAVIDGALIKQYDKKIIPKGALFGDEYLYKEDIQNPMEFEDDIVMETKGVIGSITIQKLFNVIGGTIEEVNMNNENAQKKKEQWNYQCNQIKKETDLITLEKLIFIKKLGLGQYWNVYLCKQPKKHNLYALKYISKEEILHQNLERPLYQQKQVLETICFPFIMQFYKTLKDDNYVYFLSEYIQGCEFFQTIRDIGLLSSKDSQFYLAQLILITEYLHQNNIIYRDIKPENIMVDEQGYIKLIDMDTAKILKSFTSRTYTIVGTPHYMAPEILTGKGYTMLVDLWSVGICLYELICGMVPFGEDAEDPVIIYQEIIKRKIKYPSFVKDKKVKKLIDQLLNSVPEARLGGSYVQLKSHPWFDSFNWDLLLDKQMQAPYIIQKPVSDQEINKMEGLNEPILKQIESDSKEQKKSYGQLTRSIDQDWDKDF